MYQSLTSNSPSWRHGEYTTCISERCTQAVFYANFAGCKTVGDLSTDQNIVGVVVSVSYLLKELRCETPTTSGLLNLILCYTENRDKVEIFLAFGATRMEACRPIIIEALRLASTPSINSMRLLDFQVYCFAFSDTFSSVYSELSPSWE